eukprot:535557-Pelagomonas_calceolata.AAC.1
MALLCPYVQTSTLQPLLPAGPFIEIPPYSAHDRRAEPDKSQAGAGAADIQAFRLQLRGSL